MVSPKICAAILNSQDSAQFGQGAADDLRGIWTAEEQLGITYLIARGQFNNLAGAFEKL